MLSSMTGFGEAQMETQGYSFLLEIKSLNNRFLKTTVRLPDALASLEPEVERMIRDELARGSVTYTLHMRNMSNAGPFDVNPAALEKYLGSLERIAAEKAQGNAMHIDLASILLLPGVCQLRTFTEEEQKLFMDIVETLTRQALTHLQAMRQKEGQALLEDLRSNCAAVCQSLADLVELTDDVVDNYRKRIQKRADEMLFQANLKLDQDMLMKEVALFAERSDINEEITRLRSHLEQFESTCQSSRQTGRRLDFITQEMLREANTIASKANSARISHHVVDIKVAIDRLKEQVQNIE